MPNHKRNEEPNIDRKVRPGDVAIDMAQGSWVYVVGLAAPEVAVWNQENDGNLLDYTGNWLCGATLGDRVYAVVYLGGNGVKSEPSGAYDFPESRLARYPAEEANQDLRRVQTFQVEHLLRELLEDAKRADWLESLDDQDDPEIDSLADWLQEKAATALQYKPLDFPDHEEILGDAESSAEENFQGDRERYEEMLERQAERDDEDGQDDGGDADDSAAGDDVDQDGDADDSETIEADLGTDDVADPDDSDLETETTDDQDADADDGDLGEFEDFDA